MRPTDLASFPTLRLESTMQTPAILLSALAVSIAASSAVCVFFKTEHDPADAVIAGAAPDKELAALERDLQSLKVELARVGSLPDRQPLDVVSDERIAAAVAAYLSKHGAALAVDAAAKGDVGVPDLDLDQVYQQLVGETSFGDGAEAIWSKLRKSGQLEAMVARIEKYAADNPTDPDAQVAVGSAYIEQLHGMTPGIETGRIAMKADQAFDRALKVDSEHWPARFVKATALSFWPPMFGKRAEAISNLETLVDQQETRGTQAEHYAETYLLLGNLYSDQGKTEEARATWQKGARLFPGNTKLKGRLAQ